MVHWIFVRVMAIGVVLLVIYLTLREFSIAPDYLPW